LFTGGGVPDPEPEPLEPEPDPDPPPAVIISTVPFEHIV